MGFQKERYDYEVKDRRDNSCQYNPWRPHSSCAKKKQTNKNKKTKNQNQRWQQQQNKTKKGKNKKQVDVRCWLSWELHALLCHGQESAEEMPHENISSPNGHMCTGVDKARREELCFSLNWLKSWLRSMASHVLQQTSEGHQHHPELLTSQKGNLLIWSRKQTKQCTVCYKRHHMKKSWHWCHDCTVRLHPASGYSTYHREANYLILIMAC
jgi:hypothetical protein